MNQGTIFEPDSPDIAEDCCGMQNACTKISHQYANVSIPVQLNPNTTVGDVVIECYEEPVVTCTECQPENGCELTITQKLCVKIPIKYQIDACVGESVITCG